MNDEIVETEKAFLEMLAADNINQRSKARTNEREQAWIAFNDTLIATDSDSESESHPNTDLQVKYAVRYDPKWQGIIKVDRNTTVAAVKLAIFYQLNNTYDAGIFVPGQLQLQMLVSGPTMIFSPFLDSNEEEEIFFKDTKMKIDWVSVNVVPFGHKFLQSINCELEKMKEFWKDTNQKTWTEVKSNNGQVLSVEPNEEYKKLWEFTLIGQQVSQLNKYGGFDGGVFDNSKKCLKDDDE